MHLSSYEQNFQAFLAVANCERKIKLPHQMSQF